MHISLRHPLQLAQMRPQQLSSPTRAAGSMLTANVGLACMSKFDKGGKSKVCSWRIKVRAQHVRLAAATVVARLAAVAAAHDTHSPSSSSQVNGCTPSVDAMRIHPIYHASRGDQYASISLLGSFGGQLPTNIRVVRWGITIAHVVRS